ncbi:MAG: hypothetical protein QXD64_08815, partial [Thermoplasmata archaeon]
RDVLAGDKLFGTMIEYLKHQGTIATWRNENSDWNEGVTLRVENFQYWVWVYGVEQGTDNYDRVYFTGDNFLSPSKGMYDEWPKISQSGILTYLPWRGGVSKNEKSGKFISTTEMVWKWKQYSPDGYDASGKPYYLWGEPQWPTIFTRYYDGSP